MPAPTLWTQKAEGLERDNPGKRSAKDLSECGFEALLIDNPGTGNEFAQCPAGQTFEYKIIAKHDRRADDNIGEGFQVPEPGLAEQECYRNPEDHADNGERDIVKKQVRETQPSRGRFNGQSLARAGLDGALGRFVGCVLLVHHLVPYLIYDDIMTLEPAI